MTGISRGRDDNSFWLRSRAFTLRKICSSIMIMYSACSQLLLYEDGRKRTPIVLQIKLCHLQNRQRGEQWTTKIAASPQSPQEKSRKRGVSGRTLYWIMTSARWFSWFCCWWLMHTRVWKWLKIDYPFSCEHVWIFNLEPWDLSAGDPSIIIMLSEKPWLKNLCDTINIHQLVNTGWLGILPWDLFCGHYLVIISPNALCDRQSQWKGCKKLINGILSRICHGF